MKYSFYCALILVCFSCAEKRKYQYNKLQDGAVILTSWYANSVDARSVVYNPKGIIRNIFHLKNNILDGDSYAFYDDGRVAEIIPYNNGIIKGKSYEFYRNGNLKLRSEVLDGKKTGKAIGFYPNGRLAYQASYTLNNLIGEYLIYYNSSRIRLKQKSVFIKVGNKTWNNKVVKYDTLGNIATVTGLLNKHFDKEIYKLGEVVRLTIKITNPKCKLTKVTIGKFDSLFVNRYPASQHIIYGSNHSVHISFRALKSGSCFVRGCVTDYDSIASKGQSYQTKEIDTYFQAKYKVVE